MGQRVRERFVRGTGGGPGGALAGQPSPSQSTAGLLTQQSTRAAGAGLAREGREAFGAERLMWASDCPYQVQGGHEYAASVELIERRLDFISKEDRGRILRDTAAGIFF